MYAYRSGVTTPIASSIAEQGVLGGLACWDTCHTLTLGLPVQQELFIKFAEFEEKVKEDERARAIFRYALDHIPKAQAQDVYRRFVAFEKQHGNRDAIEVGLFCPTGHCGYICMPVYASGLVSTSLEQDCLDLCSGLLECNLAL